MATQQDYDALQQDLQALERSTGLYLADQCVDVENLPEGVTETSPRYWNEMYRAAASAAGQRAEEAGRDINAMLGRVIY